MQVTPVPFPTRVSESALWVCGFSAFAWAGSGPPGHWGEGLGTALPPPPCSWALFLALVSQSVSEGCSSAHSGMLAPPPCPSAVTGGRPHPGRDLFQDSVEQWRPPAASVNRMNGQPEAQQFPLSSLGPPSVLFLSFPLLGVSQPGRFQIRALPTGLSPPCPPRALHSGPGPPCVLQTFFPFAGKLAWALEPASLGSNPGLAGT